MGFVRGELSGLLSRLVGAGACVGLVVAGVWVSPVSADTERAPVVGSFGVGGALRGNAHEVHVDERTGRVSTGFMVGGLPGLAGDGVVSLQAFYRQERVSAGDVFGLGAGWGFGVTRVDVSGDMPRVFPASGGVFDADQSAGSGLARYPGRDVTFRQEPGVFATPVGEVSFSFVLDSTTGSEYFSAAGFLMASADSFGNATWWEWDESAGRLLSVTDRAGNRLELEWTHSQVRVHMPERGDGVVARPVVIDMSDQGVVRVTDGVGESVSFGYELNGLLGEVRSSVGLSTRVSYQPLGDGGVAADTVRVVDENSAELSSTSWDVVGENVFTGFPKTTTGEGVLWGSGEGEFRYSTRVSDGVTSFVSTYNSMGLLVDRSTIVTTWSGEETVRSEKFVFEGTQDGGVPSVNEVPAYYAKPIEATTVFRDGDRSRSVTTRSDYDDLGRVVRHVDGLSAVTTTTYDDTPVSVSPLPSDLVVEQTTTGVDGTVSKTLKTPSADRKSVAVAETFTGNSRSDLASTTRSRVVTEPDGFVSERTVSLVPGAGVAEGPESVTTRFSRHVDRDAGMVTVTETTAAGTNAESSVSTASDMRSGLVLRRTDAAGGVTVTGYDVAGRPTSVSDAVGRVTRTSFGDHGRLSRVTTPDGITTSTYRDVLGRVVRIANNIVEGPEELPVVFGTGFERTVESRSYENNNARVVVIDALGRKTVSESDVFGRPLRVTLETGLTQVSVYDDVANTVTTGVTATPEHGLADALRVSMKTMDAAGRDVSVTGERSDGVRVPASGAVFDGIGRTVASTGRDIQTTMALNADGSPRTTTTTPVNPVEFPGEAMTAVRTHDMTGSSTNKTLTRGVGSFESSSGVGVDRGEGVTRVLDGAGRTVRVTDQVGGVTRYLYTVDGLVAEVVEEASGTVTRNTFDPVTRVLRESVTSRAGVEERREFEYDGLSERLVSVLDPADRRGTELKYAHDVLGNVTAVVYPDGKSITHVFDVNGRKISTTDIERNVTRYRYNELGFLLSAEQRDSAGEWVADVAYDYDVFGRVTRVSRGNGVVTEYAFTSADEIKSERTTDSSGVVIFEGEYTYDRSR